MRRRIGLKRLVYFERFRRLDVSVVLLSVVGCLTPGSCHGIPYLEMVDECVNNCFNGYSDDDLSWN